jgi:hypothetical protein
MSKMKIKKDEIRLANLRKEKEIMKHCDGRFDQGITIHPSTPGIASVF